jgi:exonuclease VII small subunit
MSADTLSTRLVEIESMLDRARRRFDEGHKLIEEAHAALGEAQQALIGSPVRLSAEDSEEASSRCSKACRPRAIRCPRPCAAAVLRSIRSSG